MSMRKIIQIVACGGDATENPLIGSWAGDRIVVQGDYADENSRAFISNVDDYHDISADVKAMLDKVFVPD